MSKSPQVQAQVLVGFLVVTVVTTIYDILLELLTDMASMLDTLTIMPLEHIDGGTSQVKSKL